MVGGAQNKAERQVLSKDTASSRMERLPYAVELWDADARAIERIIARAYNAVLARAIFKGAQAEYPDRRLTLRRRGRVIADSRI